MQRIATLIAVVLPMVVVGCGGFDPEYDCEQELACDGGGDDEEVDLCADLKEVIYDHASDKEKEEADDAYEACKDKRSCAYVTCRDAELAGLDTDDLSKETICGFCADDPSLSDICDPTYDACEGDPECLIALAQALKDSCAPVEAGPDCGDEWADEYEDCDGSDLWGEDCDSVTAGTRPNGVLSCNANCTFNVSLCMP